MKVILYGPQGSRKSEVADEILRRYKLKRIFDEWDGVTDIPDDSIAITNLKPPFKISGATVIDVNAYRKKGRGQ